MKSKNLILILWVSSLLTVLIVVGVYIYKFGSTSLSEEFDSWVSFSNYFSGIIGTVFTFLNLVILTYLSIKLAKIEDDRNTWTLQELARPFATLFIENTSVTINVTVHNIGLGPMIIKDYSIINSSGKKFKNFNDVISSVDPIDVKKFESVNPKIDSFEINSDEGAIGKDQSYKIFKLYFEVENELNKDYMDYIRNELNNFTILISYNDIYGREIEVLREKLHFKPWQNGFANSKIKK